MQDLFHSDFRIGYGFAERRLTESHKLVTTLVNRLVD